MPLSGAAAVRAYLLRVTAGLWTDRWTTAATANRGPRTPPRAYLRGGHRSVSKIVRGQHHEIPLTPPAKTNTPNDASGKPDGQTATKDL